MQFNGFFVQKQASYLLKITNVNYINQLNYAIDYEASAIICNYVWNRI